LLAFGALRLPIESALTKENHEAHFQQANLDLDLREEIGQLSFVAALSGFRSLVADLIYLEANGAWERTEWGRLLLLLRQVTTLQPRSLLYWEMAAWHMAWNASVAASRDPSLPNDALRRQAQCEYFDLGRDFLERGIRNNPERPQLYEAMARLYREKYKNHAAAARYFARAASLPGAPDYDKRFAAYELSQVAGREEQERLPTLLRRLRLLEEKLEIPLQERIPDPQM
jgi:hypothetical protein